MVERFADAGPIKEALPDLRELAANALKAKLELTKLSASLTDLNNFLIYLNGLPTQLVPQTSAEELRSEVFSSARALLTKIIPPPLLAETPEASRLLGGKADQILPNADKSALAHLFQTYPLQAAIAANVAPECGLSADDVRAFLSARLLPSAVISNDAKLVFNVRVSCAADDRSANPERLPSSYRSGVQQLANPEYAQAQVQLDAARRNLSNLLVEQALNPPANGWAGAAQGIAKALAETAVTRAQNRLLNTPPYTEHALSTPYSASIRKVSREGVVRFRIQFQDRELISADTTTDAREVELSSSIADDEITGVMPTDDRGLRNKEAILPPLRDLFASTLKQGDSAAIAAAFAELLQSALVRRAVQLPISDPVRRLGSIMLAFDISPDSDVVKPFEGIRQSVSAATIADVLSIKLPTMPASATARRVGADPPSEPRAGGSRVVVASRALRALVTIRHTGGTGSGFVIDPSGLIVTNAHVVERGGRLTAKTVDGEEYLVSVVATDADRDLALLRINGWQGEVLRLGDSTAVAVGEEVLAVGTPSGLEGTVTRGIVSAKRRLQGVSLLQVDAAISPGSSGGPLLNEAGYVIGVTSWKVTGNRIESLGFAVATSEILAAFAQFLGPR